MKSSLVASVLLICVVAASAEVFFEESFGADWASRWQQSDYKKSEGTAGKFKRSAGKWYGDANHKGIQTSEDARFYAYSAPVDKELVPSADKPIVFQFTVKHEQSIDCGGGYMKLLPKFDPENFNGDSEYSVMFGPDICGTSTRKTHVIINYNGKNHLIKKEVRAEFDRLTHLYTLIIFPDTNRYEVQIDQNTVQEGSLLEDFDFTGPKQIPDPNASKPADWVDTKEIDDPTDVKPEGYDDIPATIVDPEAEKPEDWNDEEDGEWTAPEIANPEYKGAWKAKKIPHPDYKGPWSAPLIDNPDYKPVTQIFTQPIQAVGIEIWQVKSGSIFGDVLLTDDVDYAKEHGERNWEDLKDAEKKMFDAEEEKKRAADEAERESRKAEMEANKKSAPEENDIDDDEHDHDDHEL